MDPLSALFFVVRILPDKREIYIYTEPLVHIANKSEWLVCVALFVVNEYKCCVLCMKLDSEARTERYMDKDRVSNRNFLPKTKQDCARGDKIQVVR